LVIGIGYWLFPVTFPPPGSYYSVILNAITMKRTILIAAALVFAVSFSIAQTKSQEKPLRKIASGTGAQQIDEDVREAMKEVRVELDNIKIEIDEDINQAMEEVRREMREIEFEMNEEIDIDIDEDINEDIDIDIDEDFDFDIDMDINIDIDEIVENAVNNALRAVDPDAIERIVNKAVKESTRDVKVRTRP